MRTSALFLTIFTTGYTLYLTHYTCITAACCGIFFAACCKSIQFIFISWLADVIKAPTPAAVFIHFSTLIITGVYLLLRVNYFWFYQPLLQQILCIFSSLSICLTAVAACYQTNIKRLFAYLIISQASYLFANVCLFAHVELFFYLWLHTLDKTILFVMSGYIIHLQDSAIILQRSHNICHHIVVFGGFIIIIFLSLAGFLYFLSPDFKELFLVRTPINHFGLHLVFGSFLFSFGATFCYILKLGCYLYTAVSKLYLNNLLTESAANLVKTYETPHFYNILFALPSICFYVLIWHVLFLFGGSLLYILFISDDLEYSLLYYLKLPYML